KDFPPRPGVPYLAGSLEPELSTRTVTRPPCCGVEDGTSRRDLPSLPLPRRSAPENDAVAPRLRRTVPCSSFSLDRRPDVRSFPLRRWRPALPSQPQRSGPSGAACGPALCTFPMDLVLREPRRQ